MAMVVFTVIRVIVNTLKIHTKTSQKFPLPSPSFITSTSTPIVAIKLRNKLQYTPKTEFEIQRSINVF